MGVTVGPVGKDQAADFLTTMGGAFGFDTDEDQVNRFNEHFEWDRARVAYDDDRIVGTIGSYSLEMTVPGATIPCGGTTVVSVLPTHRRRGILRMMMDSHLDDVREHDEPISGLWASDSGIYGRFGFGMSTPAVELEIRRDYGAFHRLAPAVAPVRLVTKEEAAEMLPLFYESVRTRYPGFLARSPVWWEFRHLRDSPSSREGATAYRYAVTEENGVVTGYVQYRFKEGWTNGHGEGEVQVTELIGNSPESWAGLWRFILDHDLTATIKADNRSLQDPLFDLLAAPRRARRKLSDSLWIRVMDVSRALEGRTYRCQASAVIGVHDPLDATQSTWRLDLSPEGASVTPDDGDPDVEMDLEDLGACFMGWSRFRAMGLAGRLRGDDDVLGRLDLAFSWSPAPWCSEIF